MVFQSWRVRHGVGISKGGAAAVALGHTRRVAALQGACFLGKLNPLLREAGFDRYVETLCEPYYHDSMGRRGAATAAGIPPGV